MENKSKEVYYNKITNEFDLSIHRKKIIDFLNTESLKNKSILDIGCGSAKILENLPKTIRYAGVDFLDFAIKNANNEFKEKYINSSFFVSKSDNIPFKDNCFDIVLSMYSLEHLDNPKKSLDEMIRVLKSEGHLIILAPNLELPFSMPNALRHKTFFYKVKIIFFRLLDYIFRIFGIFKFRIIDQNYTEYTGKYEKADDDLKYLISSFEVINYLKKNYNVDFIFINQPENKNKFKKMVSYFPAMRYYGDVLFFICKKK